MKILIDNGHGLDTQGNCSPHVIGTGISGEAVIDGRFSEAMFTRMVAKEVVKRLKAQGYDAEQLTPEERDVPLETRVWRANQYCTKMGAANVIVVSIHTNASGNGEQWAQGRGWEVYTSPGQTRSDILATSLGLEAERLLPGMKIRSDYSDSDLDKEANYYILTKTRCPAVLTENLFHDNVEDVKFLTSDEGFERIVRLHVDGISEFVEDNA